MNCNCTRSHLPEGHSSSSEPCSRTAGGPVWRDSAEREDSVHQSDTGGQLYLSELAVRRAVSVWAKINKPGHWGNSGEVTEACVTKQDKTKAHLQAQVGWPVIFHINGCLWWSAVWLEVIIWLNSVYRFPGSSETQEGRGAFILCKKVQSWNIV